MEDLFERVCLYAAQDADGDWGREWQPRTYKETPYGGIVLPKNQSDDREVYIHEYIYRKLGHVPDAEEEAALLAEKEDIADRIRRLHAEKSEYTYRLDYCAVKQIKENGKSTGYDFVTRRRPHVTLSEYMRSPAGSQRMQQILKGTGEEAEQERQAFAVKLLRYMVNGLKDIYRVGTVHGHINPDNIWLDAREPEKEEFKLSPPGCGCFIRSRRDDRESIDEYAAPELCADPNQPFDIQTDLYAVGLMLYRFLNEGSMPFAAPGLSASDEHKVRRSGEQEIQPPAHGTNALQYIARKLLAYERSNRYQDFDELDADLKKLDNKVTDYNPLSVVTVSNARLEAVKKAKEEERVQKEREAEEAAERAKKAAEEEAKRQAELEKANAIARAKAEAELEKARAEAEAAKAEAEAAKAAAAAAAAQPAYQPVYQQPGYQQGYQQAYQQSYQEQQNGDDYIQEGVAPSKSGRKGGFWWIIVAILVVVTIVLVILTLTMLRHAAGYAEVESSGAFQVAEHVAETLPASAPAEDSSFFEDPGDSEIGAPVTEEYAAVTEPGKQIGIDLESRTEAATEAPAVVDADRSYTFVGGKYTWEEAESYCEEHGGHLATIHSEAEWNQIMELIADAQKSMPDLKYLWLGATSTLNDDMTVTFRWVDGSDASFIMNDDTHWFYNEEIDVREPSGYDAFQYKKDKTLIREPYLLLWNTAPRKGAATHWSLNDVPDVTSYKQYKSTNMGFIMETN